jgi:hypothetical protein
MQAHPARIEALQCLPHALRHRCRQRSALPAQAPVMRDQPQGHRERAGQPQPAQPRQVDGGLRVGRADDGRVGQDVDGGQREPARVQFGQARQREGQHRQQPQAEGGAGAEGTSAGRRASSTNASAPLASDSPRSSSASISALPLLDGVQQFA